MQTLENNTETTSLESAILTCEAVISQMIFQAMLMKPDSPEMQALGQSAHETVLLLASQRSDAVCEA